MASFGYLLPSRGAVVQSETTESLTARAQADVVGLARRAEALGYEAAWIGDSVTAKPRLEPLSTLAAVAAATDAIELGTAVYLPLLRHPLHVAHQTATVDQVSGGRLTLGVGVGVRAAEREEMARFDVPFERRGAMLNEALDVITALWSGGPVDYDGEFYEFDGASVGFAPARRPPVYVASAAFDPGRGFPRTIRDRLRRHADGWLPIAVDPETYAAGLERARDLAREGDRGPLDAAYYLDTVVADTEADALDQARDFLRAYYEGDVTYDDDALTDDAVRARGLFGTPEQVREGVRAYLDAGVERFVVRFATPSQRDQLRRFRDLVDEL